MSEQGDSKIPKPEGATFDNVASVLSGVVGELQALKAEIKAEIQGLRNNILSLTESMDGLVLAVTQLSKEQELTRAVSELSKVVAEIKEVLENLPDSLAGFVNRQIEHTLMRSLLASIQQPKEVGNKAATATEAPAPGVSANGSGAFHSFLGGLKGEKRGE